LGGMCSKTYTVVGPGGHGLTLTLCWFRLECAPRDEPLLEPEGGYSSVGVMPKSVETAQSLSREGGCLKVAREVAFVYGQYKGGRYGRYGH
jgi:hypothetical protein